MTIVALTHGYPPGWNMGGEVALHRTMQALEGDRVVLTATPQPYTLDGIRVEQLNTPDVLDMGANPIPIAGQLYSLGASVVIAQNQLSMPAVRAAALLRIVSIVSVHTPPQYGSTTREAILAADYVVYNTVASAVAWGEPGAQVLHPPISPLPLFPAIPAGDAYTLLSTLWHKGVDVVLELARRMPQQRFIVVESPATHMEPKDLRERLAILPNVELRPRVAPEEVAEAYLSQTRILLVPSRYETYGMSAIEAAGHGIPAIHVDTPDSREGIGEAAILVPPLSLEATEQGIFEIESNYAERSRAARTRAEWLAVRQVDELKAWASFIGSVRPRTPVEKAARRSDLLRAAPHAYPPEPSPGRPSWSEPKRA